MTAVLFWLNIKSLTIGLLNIYFYNTSGFKSHSVESSYNLQVQAMSKVKSMCVSV